MALRAAPGRASCQTVRARRRGEGKGDRALGGVGDPPPDTALEVPVKFWGREGRQGAAGREGVWAGDCFLKIRRRKKLRSLAPERRMEKAGCEVSPPPGAGAAGGFRDRLHGERGIGGVSKPLSES